MIQENLLITSCFRPELAVTAGIMLMFLLDLFWKKHPGRVLFLTIGALNSAVSLYFYMRVVRAMFIDAPVGKVTVRPRGCGA